MCRFNVMRNYTQTNNRSRDDVDTDQSDTGACKQASNYLNIARQTAADPKQART